MHTKDLGMIGESQVLAKFVEYGIPVSIPYGENHSYDLIAEFDGKLNKIQIKTSTQDSNGAIIFPLRKTRVNSQGAISSNYEEGSVDYFILYAPTRHKLYAVSAKEVQGATQIAIRYIPPKNGQKCNMEIDYLFENVFQPIEDSIIYTKNQTQEKPTSNKGELCKKCGKPITKGTKTGMCPECIHIESRQVERPNAEELTKILKDNNGNFTKVALLFGVTDNAIRNWCKNYKLPYRSSDYK